MRAPVVFVTGKGGTGKSTIASALAAEEARRGRRVLLLSMPPPAQSATSQAAAQGPLVGERLADGLVERRTLDEARDFERFLGRMLGIESVARRLGRSRTFAAVAAAAPGLRDLVALGTVLQESGTARSSEQGPLVVVDAPSTGHSVPMLDAPSRVLELASFGPVAHEARRMQEILTDPAAFSALVVTTPEELPMRETLALREQIDSTGVARVHVVVNALWPACLSDRDAKTIAKDFPDSDAARHWRKHRRQTLVVEDLERRVGACPHVGFTFDRTDPPAEDIARLLDSLRGGPA